MTNHSNIMLYESAGLTLSGNENEIYNMGEIPLLDMKTKSIVLVDPYDIINLCYRAMHKIKKGFPYLFSYISKCRIMYIPVYPSKSCNTMCVDSKNNLWINMSFVYNECEMDIDNVYAILFHELIHLVLNHLSRFSRTVNTKGYSKELFKLANKKANICMDYEVNGSLVADGIVSKDTLKKMGALYKDQYVGYRWEDIWGWFGENEYKEWTGNNKMFDEKELKILDAVEEASKVLNDKESTDEDKRDARKELKRKIKDILGIKDNITNSVQKELKDMMNSRLGNIGELTTDMDSVMKDLEDGIDDLDDKELANTKSDIDKMMDEMIKNADEIAKKFGKSSKSVKDDVEKARKSFKDTLDKINKENLSDEDKNNLLEIVKEDLDDIISDDMEKKRKKEEREEIEKKLEKQRKEDVKKNNPFNSWIKVMKNLADLYTIGLISKETKEKIETCINDLTVMIEKSLDTFRWDDITDLNDHLDELQKLFVPDLVELINNKTILDKTEDDMKRLVDGVFEHLYDALGSSIKKKLTADEKSLVIKSASEKLRVIGQVLKTQKKWSTTDEFKDAYKEKLKELVGLIKSGKGKEVLKELINRGIIDDREKLDDNGKTLWDELKTAGEI